MSARITTLPGRVRITFDGRPRYLPDGVCPKCRRTLPAAEFLKTWRKNSNGATVCRFGSTCLKCDPPPRKFPDLHGARFEHGDVMGKVLVWRERDRNGLGPVRSLRLLRVRQAGGVFRPQPKLKRQKGAAMNAVTGTVAVDERRTFPREACAEAARRQGNLCAICDKVFTSLDKPVGDHRRPHSQGWTTHPSNCLAVHARCNGIKGARSLAWARQRVKELDRPLLFEMGVTL
jgi:hypothetical protein